MAAEEFDFKSFKEAVEKRLKKLNNPQLSAAFALRMAMWALPGLADRAEERGFLWFWDEKDRQKHLLAVLRAQQAASLVIIKPSAAARAADAADAYAAYAAARAAKLKEIITEIKNELERLASVSSVENYLQSAPPVYRPIFGQFFTTFGPNA